MFLVPNYTYIFCRSIEAQANCGRCEKHSSLDLRQTWTLHAHSSPKMPYRASQSAAQELNAFSPFGAMKSCNKPRASGHAGGLLHSDPPQIDATNTKQNTWEVMKKLILDSSKICLKWLFMTCHNAISHVYHRLKKKLWSWGHVYFVISSNSTGQPKCCPLQIKTIEKANLGHVFHTKQVRLHPNAVLRSSPSCKASISR